MTSPNETHRLHYDQERSLLLIDDALLAVLSWPDALKIERRADGLILTSWESGLDAGDHQVAEILEDTDEVDKPHLKIDAGQAELLGLQPSYNAWAEPWGDCIYALPETSALAAQDGMVAVTLALTVREVRALEALGLDHNARLRDILTAFAADLAAANDHRDGYDGLRSGGSDERDLAEQWFERNRGPGGWGDDDGRPSFGRSFSDEETAGEG